MVELKVFCYHYKFLNLKKELSKDYFTINFTLRLLHISNSHKLTLNKNCIKKMKLKCLKDLSGVSLGIIEMIYLNQYSKTKTVKLCKTFLIIS